MPHPTSFSSRHGVAVALVAATLVASSAAAVARGGLVPIVLGLAAVAALVVAMERVPVASGVRVSRPARRR